MHNHITFQLQKSDEGGVIGILSVILQSPYSSNTPINSGITISKRNMIYPRWNCQQDCRMMMVTVQASNLFMSPLIGAHVRTIAHRMNPYEKLFSSIASDQSPIIEADFVLADEHKAIVIRADFHDVTLRWMWRLSSPLASTMILSSS